MPQNKTFFLLIIISLFFSSCIHKIYNIDTNNEQTPVVNCLFTTDSVFTVYIGLTSNMYNQIDDSITNPNVKIVSENGDTLYFHKKEAHIFISDSVAKQGVNYKLIVETSNYGILTAQSKIPLQSKKIDTASFFENYFYNPNSNTLFDKINLTIKNEVNEVNYYEAVVLSKTEAGTINGIPFDKLYFSENYFTDCPIIEYYQSDNKTGNSLLFNNLNFTDQFQEIYFYCTVYNIPEETKYLIINLKQTSVDYYLYRKSLLLNTIQANNNFSINYILNNTFREENTEIYSNITGGLGIFAGYNCNENYIISIN